MALGMAAAEAAAVLNAHLRGTSYGGNASVFAKLHTADPGASGATAPATETTRQQVTFGSAASTGTISNTAAVEWTDVAATENYTHYSLWTASTAGNFLGSGTVTGGSVAAGNNFTIPIGDFTITQSTAA
jgi:hypothetical protein